jgi:hypothetical protein
MRSSARLAGSALSETPGARRWGAGGKQAHSSTIVRTELPVIRRSARSCGSVPVALVTQPTVHDFVTTSRLAAGWLVSHSFPAREESPRMFDRLSARFAALVICLATGVVLPAVVLALPDAASAAATTCRLSGPAAPVSHVVYIQFDNVHFRRDNPNVPSDLEQMPHLLNFLENGTLLANHHDPLISHTADDLVTSLTGLYGDRHGMPIANSYQVYGADGTTSTAGSFAYWTDPVVYYGTPNGDPVPTMVAPGGGNPPAPWVPYTRAGCSFGSVAMANTELENTSPDVAQVFGANSAEAQEANNNPNLASTDFQGLSIHCAQGDALCSAANHGVADVLPSEPGGYSAYRALFGSKYIAPLITGGQSTVTNFDGQPITDSSGNPGFPGYNSLQPTNSLAYTLALQEHGVPVTFTYVSSTHETADGTQFGPGQSAYVAQLHKFDQDFETFFQQLAAHGITTSNTLFVVGSDENDQFVGASPSPANCNGVAIPCTYSQLGEIDANVQGLLAAQGITTPFDLHEDSAPAFYLHGQPAPNDPSVRAFERATASVQADNPYTGGTDNLSQYLADPTELKLLHMVTADPLRTPTFAMFANPFYWVVQGDANCGGSCSSIDSTNAWNHGDVQPQITNTWAGMVGPGVARLGATRSIWSDHTDIQPTLMALLGLKDDYVPEGRVLAELMPRSDQPSATRRSDYRQLAEVYKQIDAPVGLFGTYTLRASTKALSSDSSGDRTYRGIESALANLGRRRDALAAQMIGLLDGAAFSGQKVDQREARRLEEKGAELIAEARWLAGE